MGGPEGGYSGLREPGRQEEEVKAGGVHEESEGAGRGQVERLRQDGQYQASTMPYLRLDWHAGDLPVVSGM